MVESTYMYKVDGRNKGEEVIFDKDLEKKTFYI